jgi:acetyl-CoA acyltransferase
MRDVYVVAVGMIQFGKYPDRGIKDLTAMAMKNLLNHSPVDQSAIEAAWMSNAGWGMSAGQHCIRGQVALAPLGIGEIPIMNVENACAGGSSAFQGAWLGVAAGVHEVALAVGAEKTYVPRDVEGARLGLTQNGGGFIGNGEAALAIHILEGPSGAGSARG